jgi:predicted metalloendopeptidase
MAKIINNNKNFGTDICKTDACIAAGQLLKSNLNLSADPCDDFYEFACGGYVATHTVPNDKTIIGQRFGIEDTLKQKVLQVLNGPNKASDSKSVKYTRDLYRACIDSGIK